MRIHTALLLRIERIIRRVCMLSKDPIETKCAKVSDIQ